MTARINDIEALIGDVIRAMGFELWGIEFLPQGRYSLLRVYIDSEAGITIDNCADVSRQVSALLDVENPISGEYRLEISSPGMDRTLFKLEHYRHYCGEKIAVRLKTPLEGSRNFTGVLESASEQGIVLKMDEKTHSIPFTNIQKAHVVPVF
ncbi:MAG: ribosome maturation factor RimP [Gammaproteobacteria bacterium]|nr:ribosome maturation factor RimP [Gammaproteobacteria bacterium]